MPVLTLYRLSEQALNLIEGGDPQAALSLDIPTLKIACTQVINKMLKTEHFSINVASGEYIPNGTVLGTYENIQVLSYGNNQSKATLPIKPTKLPRNMGVFSIYRTQDPSTEFIPLQMGQANLLKSQAMINDLMGQIGYEVFGNDIVFTKDITRLYPDETLTMRLVVLDMSQYDDYDMLPVPPEYEWDIITEVYKLYSSQPIPTKVVDATAKEQKNNPIKEQSQPQ